VLNAVTLPLPLPSASPAINELLLRWEEARQRGQTCTAEELCRERPQDLAEVRRRLAALEAAHQTMENPSPSDSSGRDKAGLPTPGPRSEAAVFNAARRIDDLAARRLYVRQACGEDLALAGRVEALLHAHDENPTFLASPSKELGDLLGDRNEPSPLAPAPAPGDAAPPPQRPAPAGYEILGELGRGGMGVVYRARQVALNRVVALKMILSGGHAGPDDVARFRREAEAVAQIQHPNIVQVFEVNEVDGLPFFSLEFVDGGSLERKLAGTPLPPRPAAGLVEDLARAMHAAHSRGIIHRDLKPANVLLQESGVQGQESGVRSQESEKKGPNSADSWIPKVTDFGLAKRLDDQARTQSGAVLGTPSYMAPEQAGGKSHEIGPACDTYALGAILYECLTGRPPFKAATPLDTILQVLAAEPVPPSRLNAGVPRDLETICLKCLEKEPARRYATALQLADDLHAFREDRPIAARPVGRLKQAWRWCKRNRTVAALLALVILVLSAGAVTSTILGLKAQANAEEAEVNAGRATANAQRATENARRANANARRAEAGETRAAAGERRAVETLYATAISLAHREWQDSNCYRARQILDACPADQRGWEWYFLDQLFHGELLSLRGHAGPVVGLAVSPAGDRAATVGFDGTARVWDTRTGLEMYQLSPAPSRVTFSPDGRRLAGTLRAGVQLWDADAGRRLAGPFPVGPLHELAFVDGGRRLAVLTRDGTLLFLDPDTGAEVERCPKKLRLERQTAQLLHAVQPPVFSRDGRYVAQGGTDGKVRVWDARTGEKTLEGTGHVMGVGQVTFSPDGKRLASPGGDGVIRLWDLATKQVARELHGHRMSVHAVAFSPDGSRLASAGKDTTARVWDVATGSPMLTLRGHVSEVWGVSFGADGKRVFTRGADAQVKVWDVEARTVHTPRVKDYLRRHGRPDHGLASSGEAWTYYGHTSLVSGLALGGDGRRAATAAALEPGRGEVLVWDLDRHQVVRGLPVPEKRIHQLAFSPDERLLAVASSGVLSNVTGELRLFEVDTGRLLHTWSGDPCIGAKTAFSPDGQHLACTFPVDKGTSRLVVREVATGKELFVESFPSRLIGLCYLGSDWLVVATNSTVHVLNARTGKDRWSWQSGQGRITAVAVSSAGTVATGDNGGPQATIRLWDAATGRPLRTLEGQVGVILGLAFSPDGSRLFSCASDFTTKLWHTGTGHELLTFREHRDVPLKVAWSGDGRRLAAVGQDWALKVWERGAGVAVPNTDDWERLYRDDFKRNQLGDRWQALDGTRWTVRDGVLRGAVEEVQGSGDKRTQAKVRLRGVELPRTVEVRFRVSTSRLLVFRPILHDPRAQRSLAPMVACLDWPGGFRGAALLLLNHAGGLKPALLGSIRPYRLEPGRTYRFRIVRTPKRLWLFINGSEVLAEEVPSLEAPELHLAGSWSDKPHGTEITFTDLEIRAPTVAKRERRLRSLVERHFDRLGARQAVREELDSEFNLSARDRALARELVNEMTEDPEWLVRTSLATSTKKEASPAERRVALLQAEAARDLVLGREPTGRPRRPASLYLTAVGLARLRAGQAKKAQAELTRAVQVRRQDYGAAVVRQLAALALAAWQLGQKEQAAALRLEMHDLRRDAEEKELQEAAPWVAEVDALIRARPDDTERDTIFRAVYEPEAAGWQRHDLAGFLAGRTADYREEAGRTATPDKHDVLFDRVTLQKARAWDFYGPAPKGWHTRIERFRVELLGSEATVFYEATAQHPVWFRTWAVRTRLKKSEQGWKIAFLRGWPVRGLAQDRCVAFDTAWWKARDVEADKAPEAKRAALLLEAERLGDALALLRRRTAAAGASAEEWALRGRAALRLGKVDEAREAFRRAEENSPEIDLPPAVNGPFLELHGHQGAVFSVAYLPSGDLLSGGSDGKLRRWDSRGKLVREVAHPLETILALAATRDGKRIATANTRLCFWEPDTLKPQPSKAGHAKKIYRIAFSHDGSRLVTASADHTARTWDAATGAALVEFRGHTKDVLGAVFSPDGKYLATASHDGTARLWDASTGKLVRTFTGHIDEVIRVAFAPDGKRLATAGNHGEVKVWSVATAKVLHTLEAGHELVEVVAFSPNGRLLAAAGMDGLVRLWDARTMHLVRVLRGHTRRVFSLAFSEDSKRLAAGADEATVRVWEVPVLR
jgi:WD40 repeat protein/serine/threonine protein kinase